MDVTQVVGVMVLCSGQEMAARVVILPSTRETEGRVAPRDSPASGESQLTRAALLLPVHTMELCRLPSSCEE